MTEILPLLLPLLPLGLQGGGSTAVKEGFGEWEAYGKTALHPLGVTALVILGLVTLLGRRRNAALPLMLVASLIPQGQRIAIATLDFNFVRLIVLCSWVRIVIRGEASGLRLGGIDYCVIAWSLVTATARTLLTGALVNQLGNSFDVLGIYFALRVFMRSWADVDRMIGAVCVVSLPVFVLFLYEHYTAHNLFSVLGGVDATTIEREGRLRCQGPFPHPVLAGAFWAAMFPLVLARALRGRRRFLARLSVGGILGIVVFSASSTPVLGVAASLAGFGCFYVRQHMRTIRWAVFAGVVGLHLVMKAPVWHLIGRIRIVGGSTGYHRYKLIDAAVNNVGEWWLIGTPSTAHWGRQLFDVTNQYVAAAINGGLAGLLLFLASIALAFRLVGQAWRHGARDRYRTFAAWGLGCSIFGQCMMFIAATVTHSQANVVAWFLPITMTAGIVAQERARRSRARALRPARGAPGRRLAG